MLISLATTKVELEFGGVLKHPMKDLGIVWSIIIMASFALIVLNLVQMASTSGACRSLLKLCDGFCVHIGCGIFYLSLTNNMNEPKKVFGNFRKLSLANPEESRETRAISVEKFTKIFLARVNLFVSDDKKSNTSWLNLSLRKIEY